MNLENKRKVNDMVVKKGKYGLPFLAKIKVFISYFLHNWYALLKSSNKQG
tara:strand:- start:8989 stop:9138 length:150 start_codon:yes stop_codon:yes gene_type:complete